MAAKFERWLGCAALAATILAAAPATAQIKPPGASVPLSPPSEGEQFDDWRKQCDAPQDGKPGQCFLLQKANLKENNRTVLAVQVAYLGEKQIPAIIISVPLGIFLPGGLVLTVPGSDPVRLHYEACTVQFGCRTGTPLTEPTLAAMRKATMAEVTVVEGVIQPDGKRRAVKLPISLKGFTKGFAALKKN